MRITLVLLTGLLLLPGCAKSDPAGPYPAHTAVAADAPAALLVGNFDAYPHDDYSFVSARVDGDLLHVSVAHGGGCVPDHDFRLLVSPVFMESFPVQMQGSLSHDGKGDPCRAVVGRDLSFDLRPLRDAYREAYGPGAATIHLVVSGWPQRVAYSF
jgi:hypothetical protein